MMKNLSKMIAEIFSVALSVEVGTLAHQGCISLIVEKDSEDINVRVVT